MNHLDPQLQEFLEVQEARVRHQRRISSIASLVIAFILIALVMLVLALVLLPSLGRESAPIVAYTAAQTQEDEIRETKPTRMQAKPSAPSMSAARVIVAEVTSPTSIPVPDLDLGELSTDYGIGDDIGDGWAEGTIDGIGGGGTTFFRQTVAARRVCYVIDYSLSMKGEREKLMRDELTRSVEQIGPAMEFQMIFFAGPAWVAGSEVAVQGRKTATVTHKGRKYKWSSPGNAHHWKQDGRKQSAEWLQGGGKDLEKALQQIKSTKLVWGTIWEPALEMALEMDPAPQIIYFMTDGATGGDMVALAKKLGRKAKRTGTVINTVAMMQPKAESAMKELAKQTGGQFSIVRAGGKVEVVEAK